MGESRLSVRVDTEVKDQAEAVFKQLGLNLSSGVNAFLHRVVAEQGMPFPLTARRWEGQPVAVIEHRARAAVQDSTAALGEAGAPVALYDTETQRPYLLYPDGRTSFET